jgi:hypothetical protein
MEPVPHKNVGKNREIWELGARLDPGICSPPSAPMARRSRLADLGLPRQSKALGLSVQLEIAAGAPSDGVSRHHASRGGQLTDWFAVASPFHCGPPFSKHSALVASEGVTE